MLNTLLIEDDKDLAPLIKEYLELEGITCDIAKTGVAGLQCAKSKNNLSYDCIILDLNLPTIDGLSVCKNLRTNHIYTPIIMLTARDKLNDKLAGFSAGADDYLCKPFEMEELIARIKALTARILYNDELRCDDLIVNISTKTVLRGIKNINLTQIEFNILVYLLINSPKIVSKQKIIDKIWGDEPPESDSLKVHVHNLRKSIDGESRIKLIHTIPGHGYGVYAEGVCELKK